MRLRFSSVSTATSWLKAGLIVLCHRDISFHTYICPPFHWHFSMPCASLTPWSRVLLENLAGFQLVKKFPALYPKVKSARHLSLSWASSIQSIPPHPTSWRAILILSSHLRLGLPSGLFPSGFPTKTLYTIKSRLCYICIYIYIYKNITSNETIIFVDPTARTYYVIDVWLLGAFT